MDKWTRLVPATAKKHIKVWQKNLESLLEANVSMRSPTLPEVVHQFEPSTDLSHLKVMLQMLPKDRMDCLVTLFSRMSVYFHSGLLLNIAQLGNDARETWVPSSAFKNGEYFEIPTDLQSAALSLPVVKFGEIRKSSPYCLLSPLQLESLCDAPEASAFCLRAADDYLFMFFTTLPEPWLRTHVEAIHQQILSVVADLP